MSDLSNITKAQLRGDWSYKKAYCSSVGWTQVCFIPAPESHSSSRCINDTLLPALALNLGIRALITRSRTIRYGCNSQGDGAVWQPSDQSCSIIHFSAVDASWSDFSRKLLGAPLWAKSSCTPWFLHISRSSVGQNQSVLPATDGCEKLNGALRRFAVSTQHLWSRSRMALK